MPQEILAVVWVDTEDFITPESDDGALTIANTFEKHGVHVNFKLVGEEVRQLLKRNRRDVIEAISRHDVGFHSNLHSVHPTMSEYIDDLGWEEGVKEWEKMEYEGFEDVKGAFGRGLACYGHPGSSWIPQVYPVMKKWNIPVYLDDMETISSKNERPYYFCNTLNLQGFGRNVLCLDSPPSSAELPADHLLTLGKRLQGIIERLSSAQDVPIIGMYCHPNSYSTEEFWDVVNFKRGKNPVGFKSVAEPGSLRKPKLKSPEKTKEDLEKLDEFLNLATSIPHFHFITATDALRIYRDKADGRRFTEGEMQNLCEKNAGAINYQTLGDGVWVSAAEAYYMTLYSLAHYLEMKELPRSIPCLHPLGPTSEYEGRIAKSSLRLETFLSACTEEERQINRTGYISSSVRVDGVELSPKDVFATCCRVFMSLSAHESTGDVVLQVGNFEVGDMVTEKGARADWSYYFLPSGFRAPMQTKLARLQTWTLKPAEADLSAIHNQSLASKNDR